MDLQRLAADFDRDGYVSAIDILTEPEAAGHRARMETVEAEHGPLHYKAKAHTILTSPWPRKSS